ncbi:hypothetical protein Q428_11120 [Fervidicella metallireducens AeB]|uniref:Uncharacterized protein n=1 Tax=Fervidicella metallireducens AeB TaxID=1403537 RepID=A0A017RT57_9CLOT|nr:hypothetical protein [Fervidicella metallireducens]EYE87857.1 hypothetical protein Q428_11120 [Fervidicella metallireducens AeB]
MIIYNGKKDSIKNLSITFIVCLLILIVNTTFITNLTAKVVLFFIFIPVTFMVYKGIILKITLDDEKIKIYKPFYVNTIYFKDIAFCALHGIDDERSLLYAFVRKKWPKKKGVRGIKANLSFEDIVKIVSQDEGNTNLDINFNMAAKVPLSFVENSDDLKTQILTNVSNKHKEILKNM